MTMIRGTTPAVVYKFNVVDPADITVAYLTIRQGATVIEKTLADGNVVSSGDDRSIAWELTQAETLSLTATQTVMIQLRYKLRDGSAHATKTVTTYLDDVIKDGVI
jgi:hypothetical protein